MTLINSFDTKFLYFSKSILLNASRQTFFCLAEDTAHLLTELADSETKKGTAIHAPVAISKEREQVQLISFALQSSMNVIRVCNCTNHQFCKLSLTTSLLSNVSWSFSNREFKKLRLLLQRKRNIKKELSVGLSILRVFHVCHVEKQAKCTFVCLARMAFM